MSGDELMKYDDVCTRIYMDIRMTPGTREFALALSWVTLRDSERTPADNTLARVARILGRDDSGRWRHKLLLAGDAPQYVEPSRLWDFGVCEGPRLRPYRSRARGTRHNADDRVCGADGSLSVPEPDPTTGQVARRAWFCRRHAEHAKRVQHQIKALGEPPPPIPNSGGILPSYFEADWERLYRWASPGWEPPYYGVCADDWPVAGVSVIPKRPRLSLVVDHRDVS